MERIKLWFKSCNKITPSVILISIATGIALAWPNTIISLILLTISDFDLIVYWIPLASTLFIFPAAYFSDRFGRKKVLFVCAIAYILSLIVVLILPNKTGVIISVLFAMLGRGIFYTTMPMYLGEVSQDKFRGRFTALMPFSVLIGQTFASILYPFLALTSLAVIYLIFPILFIVILSFQPESPYYYLKCGQDREAETSLQKLLNSDNVTKELNEAKDLIEEQIKIDGHWIKRLNGSKNRTVLLVLIVVFYIKKMCEPSFIQYYLFTIFIRNPLKSGDFFLIYYIVRLLLCTQPLIFSDKFGRKFLLCLSCSGIAICQALLGVYFYYTFKIPNENLDSAFTSVVFLLIVFYCIGLDIIPHVIISEVFSITVKAYAIATIECVSTVLFHLDLIFFNVALKNDGPYVQIWISSIVSIAAFLLIIIFLPETKTLSLSSIQKRIRKEQ